jgi:hypothetical protein
VAAGGGGGARAARFANAAAGRGASGHAADRLSDVGRARRREHREFEVDAFLRAALRVGPGGERGSVPRRPGACAARRVEYGAVRVQG